MTDWFAPSFWVGGNPYGASDYNYALNSATQAANAGAVAQQSAAASAPTGYNPVYNSPVGFGDYGYGTVGNYPSFNEASGGGGYQQPASGGDPNATPYDDYGPQWLGGAIDPMTGEQRSIGTMGMNDMGLPPDYGQPGGGGSSFADRFNAAPQSMRTWHPQSYDGLPQAITSGVQPSTDFGRVPENFNSRFAPVAGESMYTPQDFPGWNPPERRGMAIGIDPMTGETIFSGGAMNSMNAMPGGVPMPQARPDSAPSDFSSRYQFQTPTPQERPAEAPPPTTQNPVSDRWMPPGWAEQFPYAAEEMRNAITRQVMDANNRSWTYTNAPTAGVTPGYQPDQLPFTGYNYRDTLTPNNQNQYRGLEGQYLPGTYDNQLLLEQIDRALKGAGQDLLGPSDVATPYQPGG